MTELEIATAIDTLLTADGRGKDAKLLALDNLLNAARKQAFSACLELTWAHEDWALGETMEVLEAHGHCTLLEKPKHAEPEVAQKGNGVPDSPYRAKR